MKQDYKLSSSFSRYLALTVCSIMAPFFVMMSFVSGEKAFIALVILPVGLAIYYLRIPTVIARRGIIVVKKPFEKPVTYPMDSIVEIRRERFGARGMIILKNGKTIHYAPAQFEMTLNFFNYGEHVMKRIKELEEG